MKSKKILFLVLSIVLFVLIGSSVYISLIAKSSKGIDYLIIGQMFVGIGAAIITLFMGLKAFDTKKAYQILFIAFLELLLVFAIVCLNYVYGYGRIVTSNNYIEHMKYISLEFNIYIYLIFIFIIGLLNLNAFINEKFILNKNIENVEENKA